MQGKQRRITVGGAPEGFDAKLIADLLAKSDFPVFHIARDDRRLTETREALRFFDPGLRILEFPAWDCPPYSRISPNRQIVGQRVSVLTRLAKANGRGKWVLLTTLNAALQRIPGHKFVSDSELVARVGKALSMEQLTAFLERAGYSRCPKVFGSGEYAVRGSIVDVYAANAAFPYRFDFFGDQLDGIRRFDPQTQLTVDSIGKARLGLDSEFRLNGESIERFRRRYRAEFGTARQDDRIYTSVSEGTPIPGLEHWLPFFHDQLCTIFDYVPDAIICMDDRFSHLCELRWQSIEELYRHRADAARQKISHRPSPPADPRTLYLDHQEFEECLRNREVRQFVQAKLPVGLGCIDAGGRKGRDFSAERMRTDQPLLYSVAAHLRQLRRNRPTIIACWSEGSRSRFASMLGETGVETVEISDFGRAGRHGQCIDLAVCSIVRGFTTDGFAVLSEQDVFGERLVRQARKRRPSAQLLDESSGFVQGDLVVHEQHGIGRYQGLKTIVSAGISTDCAVLEYAGGDKLLLPVFNIGLLSRYGSGESPLDRLGAAHWQARRARAKKSLLEMAAELIRVAAERAVKSAPILKAESMEWDGFRARFQHRETEDQARAIEDTLKDLEAGHPMDRLICGDVGFGKTEVAMRAAFAAAMSGAQTVVIAPTTLLVRQHFDRFQDRFAGFPIQLCQLSRLVGQAEAEEAKRSVADGSCDIVIGTHALLSKSIQFKNLGLLVVDEEQSFGVAQKESLKDVRTSVHVLSMTATPIPRTLQLALSGVRDLSIIATPPVDRLAIRTYVLEFDAVTVRTALLHELYRGGQSLIVVPRIMDLPELEEFLQAHVPEVSFVTAHGRLSKTEMEARTGEFYDGRWNVLLSTTIIAAGLDIPATNTIIIVRADRFGLAQLHQIRGRVGRSGIRAYAYITYARQKTLTETAARRLEILSELDMLGTGFNLAARDLDMRGSGNILGEAQKGHIEEIGVELYQKMLQEAVASLKKGDEPMPQDEGQPVQLNLGVSALIPHHYVTDIPVRLGLYRRIGNMTESSAVEGFAAELIDRFGALPKEVKLLLGVVRIKEICRQAGISRIDAGSKGASVEFQNDSFENPAGILDYIMKQKGQASVRGNKLTVRRSWSNDNMKLKGVRQLAKDILEIKER
ncbi:MAG: transcription-repair coupling factor [Rhodobacteraceae bacterium]|nr:transcription-repair coupling factor [Paracoccaceae bacterium]